MAAVVTQLLFAQGTLILAGCAVLTARISRWRSWWLVAPAAVGAVWTAAIGPGRASGGLVAGPRQVAAYLAGTAGHPARLLHLSAAFSGAAHWVPRQLPLALLAAAAEAAILAWLGWSGPAYRPGLVHAILRRRTEAALSGGGLVTRAGCGLGLDSASGRPAELSWADAAGGVLVGGADALAAARVGFPVACAAIRRRKSVIVIDLTGSEWLTGAMATVAEAAGAPLRRFSSAGPACYEPFRGHSPSRAAGLVTQMIDWTGLSDQQRQAGQRYLSDACAVLAATPPAGTVLEGLSALLEPAALRGAMSRVPGHLPHRDTLARRVAGSAAALAADPAVGAALGGQLHRLRASTLGRWLRPPAAQVPARMAQPPARMAQPPARMAQPPVSVGQAVRDRGGVVFSLDRAAHGEPAAMVGRLAIADLVAVLSDLREQQLRADCLAWVHGCEGATRQSLADLTALGPRTGTVLLLSTGSAAAAARLAPAAHVVVAAGPVDEALATRLAELVPVRDERSRPAVADLLRWQDEDEFAVLARGPRRRFQPACRSVPAPWAGPL